MQRSLKVSEQVQYKEKCIVKKIILTGGGTAGHVTPNLALLPALSAAGFTVEYIGAANGMEKELVSGAGIAYHGISAGKLRRDRLLSAKNIGDAFGTLKGVGDAYKLIKKIKPDVVFSKGGFVSVPVVIAARMRGIPAVIHESDMTPGLANKLAFPFASAVCATFPETVSLLPKKKAALTGTPIRQNLFLGSNEKGLALCGFGGGKPVALVMGGSLGASRINEAVREALPLILPEFDIAHICGKGKTDENFNRRGYKQFEYLNDELTDVLAACRVIISRAGANSISEFLALRRPSLLIPLANKATRGDQVLNAASFEKRGFSMVIEESALTPETLAAALKKLYAERSEYILNMKKSPQSDGIAEVMKVILKYTYSKPDTAE